MNHFFVLGNPRSGTSLFRLMLNSHPDIVVPPECGFALWLAEKYNNNYNIDINDFISDVIKCRKFETWGITEKNISDEITNNKKYSYYELLDSVYTAYAKKTHKSPTLKGDKNNYYIEHVDEIKELFPKSKLIFIVRDGRDVACSYLDLQKQNIQSKYKPNLPSRINEIAKQWSDNSKKIIKNKDNSIVIRYEDLLENPDDELLRICNYLGVNYTPRMLEYSKSNDEPAEFLQWKGKTKDSIDKNNKNKYSTLLSKNEIDEFNAIAGIELVELGYKI